jgi:acetyltransferase-like isoleucine patch superfamily enzyme
MELQMVQPQRGSLLGRLVNKLHSLWMAWTYPFISVGRNFSAHYSCDLRRPTASRVKIGDSVILERDSWLNIPTIPASMDPVILIGDHCRLGRRCVISAKNRIDIERNVIFGPSALVMDHNHSFEDVTAPISQQGVTPGGTIRIEEGSWIGYGAAVICNQGELVIGRNSVIGANSVLTRSVPPNSVVTGNPARVVKQFDHAKGQWVLGSSSLAVATAQSK